MQRRMMIQRTIRPPPKYHSQTLRDIPDDIPPQLGIFSKGLEIPEKQNFHPNIPQSRRPPKPRLPKL